jgi:hypothetical protein
MRLFPIGLLLALALTSSSALLTGCRGCTVDAGPAAEAPTADPDPVEEPEAVAEAPEEVPAAEVEEEPERVALTETGEAPVVDPCEQAAERLYMIAAATGTTMVEPRDNFIRGCESLPEEMRQCLVMEYEMQHRAECREIRQGLTERQRQDIADITARRPGR